MPLLVWKRGQEAPARRQRISPLCCCRTKPNNGGTKELLKYFPACLCIFSFFPSLQSSAYLLATQQAHSNLSDDELLNGYRQHGDNSWLGSLLQRYTLLLLGVAMKYLKDKELAQDAVQQVFLKALVHLPQGEIQNFKGWLYILMRNHCLQQLRDKTYLATDDVLHQIPAGEDAREALLLHDHTLEQMNQALNELTTEQKNCISLFYLQRQSYQAITEATGFTFAQVKSHIQNGKRNLRILLLKKLANKKPE